MTGGIRLVQATYKIVSWRLNNFLFYISFMKTSDPSPTTAMTTLPKALRWARIVAAVAVARLIGLILISGEQSGIPAYYANTFGVGDALVGLTAIPVAYALGRGGIRTYGLAVGWAIAGILDILYAIAIAGQAPGLLTSVSNYLGVGLVVLPIALIIQFVVLALLLTPSVSRYMARKSGA